MILPLVYLWQASSIWLQSMANCSWSLEPYCGASTKVADRGMGQVKKVSCNLTDKEIHLFFFMKIANNLGYDTLFLGSEIL